ncbi:hypothetical protein KKB41_02300 [Patescibacteria group bacterium]|nr:hypothetical protein [Patescibacteria group bacterium]
MKIHFLFWTVLVALVLAVVVLTGGCATTPYSQGYGYRGGNSYGGNFARYQTPTPPPNAGFLYRPPVGWSRNNPRSLRITNESDELGARCWLDGKAILPVGYGAVARAPIVTRTGIVLVPMLPPGAGVSHIIDVGEHHLRCQLYAGPPPFQLAYEMQLDIWTDWGGKEIHLRPDLSPMHTVNRPADN